MALHLFVFGNWFRNFRNIQLMIHFLNTSSLFIFFFNFQTTFYFYYVLLICWFSCYYAVKFVYNVDITNFCIWSNTPFSQNIKYTSRVSCNMKWMCPNLLYTLFCLFFKSIIFYISLDEQFDIYGFYPYVWWNPLNNM